MGRTFAGILGLTAFVTVLVRGLIDGHPYPTLLLATVALFVFAAMGWVIGKIAETTVEGSVRAAFEAQLAAAETTPPEAAEVSSDK